MLFRACANPKPNSCAPNACAHQRPARSRWFLIAGALAVLLATPAFAADIPSADAPPPPLAPEMPKEEFTAGWYLRGDVAYGVHVRPQADYTLPGAPPIGPIDYRSEKISSGAALGLGVGLRYRFARFDLTYDVSQRNRFGGDVPPFNNWNYVGPFPVPSRRDRFDVQTHTLLANGYVDLGSWSGITPYIGAGVGMARYKVSNYVSDPYPLTAALGGVVINSPLGSAAKWNFAWALMAGASVDITSNLKLDIGYRYLNMGDAKFNHVDATGATTANIVAKKIARHEIRAGLRYEFSGKGW